MKAWKQTITGLVIATGVLTGAIPASSLEKKPVPKGLWQAFSETRHQVEPVKNSSKSGYTYKAYNLKMRYGVHFGAKGIVLRTKAGDMTMGLVAYGEEKHLKPVSISVSKSEGNKVIFQYARLSAWYINDPKKGLEQGFTLQKPENYHPAKPVVIALKIDGKLQAKQKSDTTVAFYDGMHKKVFDYKGLKAFDAKGRSLPAHLALQGNRLHIIVETAEAQWPVSVDPVFVSEQEVVASDAIEDDWFGWAVALDGDTALIGSPWNDENGADSGAAYIFTRSSGVWSQEAKLRGSDTTAGDSFGYAVSVEGNITLVGAPLDDENGINDCGAVYIFTRSDEGWSQKAKLVAWDAAAGDRFGSSVSLDGNTSLIGAPYDDDQSGSAYVFIESGETWEEQQKLIASDVSTYKQFGYAVSLDGNTSLIGAAHDNVDDKHHSGSAYVFTRSNGQWSEEAKLTSPDEEAYDVFGSSVSLDGNTSLIGAPQENGNNGGSAYIFTRSNGQWSQQAKLIGIDTENGDHFGYAVSLDSSMALIGVPYDDDNGSNSGSVYIFIRSGSTWNQQKKLTASDAEMYDRYGRSVFLDGHTALVGAPRNNDGEGSAYFITLPRKSQNLTPVIIYLLD